MFAARIEPKISEVKGDCSAKCTTPESTENIYTIAILLVPQNIDIEPHCVLPSSFPKKFLDGLEHLQLENSRDDLILVAF